MNKWALDRFNKVGPLLPQNFQLVDISGDEDAGALRHAGAAGEPHYAQMIKADKIKPVDVYKPA
jgi:nitrous-oxide reductase